jgi:hypothetical protein
MTNQSQLQLVQPICATFNSTTSALAVSLSLFGRRKVSTLASQAQPEAPPAPDATQNPADTQLPQPPVQPEESPTKPAKKPKAKRKPKGVTATKYELKDEKLTFYVSKGLFKKHWVVLKEFPLYEITKTEVVGNLLGVTWNEVAYWFNLKKTRLDEIGKLHQEIVKLTAEHRQATDAQEKKNQRVALRKSELLAAINASLPLIDGCFDVLMGLHAKRVNWPSFDDYSKPLVSGAAVKSELLPPLEVNCAQVSEAIQMQSPKDTSKEAFAIIKAIHDYFAGLRDAAEIADVAPNFEHGCMVVLAYLTLNDLMLARVVGERDSKKEVAYFEEVLAGLAAQTLFKVAAEELKAGLDRLGVEGASEDAVFEARRLFRSQLAQL